jgi:putative nucleotidyltransferase with HDIG domain
MEARVASGTEFVKAKRHALPFYEVPLFAQTDRNHFVPFKPQGIRLSKQQAEAIHQTLFFRQEERAEAMAQSQNGFHQALKETIEHGTGPQLRHAVTHLLDDVFEEPRSGNLKSIHQTLNAFVERCMGEKATLESILTLSVKDYSTAIHSLNVMGFTIGYCVFTGHNETLTRTLGMGALYHDIGKSEIPTEILKKPGRLTDLEFHQIKQHPLHGGRILQENGFPEALCRIALEHHEKLDGSGYPHRKTDISYGAKIIGIIDIYEALTTMDRPYRSAMTPMEALTLIKQEVGAKLDPMAFSTFVQSLHL